MHIYCVALMLCRVALSFLICLLFVCDWFSVLGVCCCL